MLHPTYILKWNPGTVLFIHVYFIYSHSNSHNHSTRSRNKLVLSHFNKSRSQSSSLYQSIKQWDILPDRVKTSDILFKFKLKTSAAYIDFE